MSTIISPRMSTTSLTTPSSSRRPSLDSQSQPHSQAPSPSLGGVLPPRRGNRAALRDYYNLKNAAPVDASSGVQQQQQHEETAGGGGVRESELDADGFDAEGYVRVILARESLEGLLRIEGGLINEIKGLDGERKALVYDNYSKLISATDTIRKMRTNMDPLTPTTSTLSPAISHIAETAAALAKVPQQRISKRHEASKETGEVAIAEKKKEKETGEVAIAEKKKEKETGEVAIAEKKKKEEKETVRWVLQAPQRLRSMRDANRGDEAAKDWNEVRRLLEKWEGVAGVDEIQNECMQVMA